MNNSQITNLLQSILNSRNINNVSDATGLTKVDVKNVMAEALPKLLNWMQSNLSNPQNINSLYDALDDHQWIDFSDWISLQEGQKILSHIFSNPNQVWQKVSNTTWVSNSDAMWVLSWLAPIVMSVLWNQKANWAGQNDIAGLISGLTSQANSGLMLSLFDKNRNWKINDDIFSMLLWWLKNLFFWKRR